MITFSRLGGLGRLGNQLWQIASTVGIAEMANDRVGFPKWDYQPYFRVPELFFPELSAPLIQSNTTPYVNHMDPRAREYLQDYGLWKAINARVWNWFQPSEQAMALHHDQNSWFWELERPLLSVHVRRGDNANQPNNCHPVRPMSFYEEAIDSLRGDFASICFFSDDPEWVKREFGGYAVEYPLAFFVGTPRAKEHEPAYRSSPALDWIDLQFMSFCDRHIISNSTYSWWGAFLSHDYAPIYPTPWFGTDLDYIDAGLMFPKSWVALDHGQQYV